MINSPSFDINKCFNLGFIIKISENNNDAFSKLDEVVSRSINVSNLHHETPTVGR
jgi:hypothetical protein